MGCSTASPCSLPVAAFRRSRCRYSGVLDDQGECRGSSRKGPLQGRVPNPPALPHARSPGPSHAARLRPTVAAAAPPTRRVVAALCPQGRRLGDARHAAACSRFWVDGWAESPSYRAAFSKLALRYPLLLTSPPRLPAQPPVEDRVFRTLITAATTASLAAAARLCSHATAHCEAACEIGGGARRIAVSSR